MRARPDAIVAINTPGVRAAIDASRDTAIPIVMVNVADPVATGFVGNLSRPGGRVTGVSNLGVELGAKRFRVAIFFNSDDPVTAPQIPDAERAARGLAMDVRFFRVNAHPLLVAAFEQAAAYVDRILKGARAGDIPVEQPTKIERVIKLRTAKALGVRADRVVE